MQNYVIEVRILGYSKSVIKKLTATISRTFGIRSLAENDSVPHITLVGPLCTDNEKKLISEVYNVAKKFSLVGFKFNNFGIFSNRAVYVSVIPSDDMICMRNELIKRLNKFCQLGEYDHKRVYIPHVTLVLDTDISTEHDVPRKLREIIKFLRGRDISDTTKHVMRVTIIAGNSEILCEYDLMLGRMLNGTEILDEYVERSTVEKCKEMCQIIK